MKLKLLYLFALCSFIYSNAQTTFIPDVNFENYLETHNSYGNVVPFGDATSLGNGIANDHYVTTAKIANANTLFIQELNISDLTGLEDFNSLVTLYCYRNNLTSLNIVSNPNLRTINCSTNNLTNITFTTNQHIDNLDIQANWDLLSIDISNLYYLETFDFSGVGVSSIDFSNNLNLKFLTCTYNDITNLDLTNNTDLRIIKFKYNNTISDLDLSHNSSLWSIDCTNNDNLASLNVQNGNGNNVTFFDARNNPSLYCVQIDNMVLANNAFSPFYQQIDSQASYSLDCHYGYTHVPDDNFEQALIDLGYDTAPLDDYVLTANIENVTSLNIPNKSIADLIGIEDFSSLENLYCQNNALTSLDVSSNLALRKLNCGNNQIVSLDVSQNSHLYYLHCDNNGLTSLNAKNGNNTNFTQFYATGNPNLTCIEVDSPAWSQVNWLYIDAASNFSVDCGVTQTYVPDDNFEQKLIDLGYDTAPLDNYVPTANINTITALDVEDTSIADLTGIEDFIALEHLNCINNLLTTLDLSSNAALNNLECDTNQLTYLYLDNNPQLANLYSSNNQLIELDLSNNTALTSVQVNNNNLLSLNVKNGNNTAITSFGAQNNPDLACIEVDDAAWSTSNWIYVDATSNFSTNCNNDYTYVPDDNFEQALIDLGYDSGALNNFVPTANINTITNLDLSNKSISDMTGIEDFVALTVLNCDTNNLSSINVSTLTALDNLNVSHNQLTTIDLSNNTALRYLFCGYNQFSTLNLGNNTALKKLSCYVNQITTLELDNNGALERLKCQNNQLQTLELSLNTALTLLTCQNNNIQFLNLDTLVNLVEFNAHDNNLNRLSLKNGNNTNFTYYNSLNNPNLTCIQVDDATWSTANWTNIDAISTFNTYCNYNNTYVPDDNFEQALIDLGYDSGALDNYVPYTNISSITTLDISNKNISDLTGIQDFIALVELDCSSNNLDTINLSYNNALQTLKCPYNDLTVLDLSGNIALQYLSVHNNTPLVGLDLSMLGALTYFDGNVCDLTSLNIKNGNNTNMPGTNFKAYYNPNLTCIIVDNVFYSNTNWTQIGASSTFVNSQAECNALSIDDVNFDDAISIYPNPAKDSFTINNNGNFAINKITIYDVLGKVVYQANAVGNSIDTSNFKTGLYLVKIDSNSNSITKKLIVRR